MAFIIVLLFIAIQAIRGTFMERIHGKIGGLVICMYK